MWTYKKICNIYICNKIENKQFTMTPFPFTRHILIKYRDALMVCIVNQCPRLIRNNLNRQTLAYSITLVYKIFLKNALYLVFNWFPLIFGCWFRIWSPFLAIWSKFCSVASFRFFGLENQIFEIFKNLAIFFSKICNIF